jgi:hypothetical protein
MPKAWITGGACVGVAVAVLLDSVPLKAVDNSGFRPVAEELDKRTKPPASGAAERKGLSDSAVRIMTTFAFSIIPDEVPGPDGKPAKVDKSDPNKFFIPLDDARRVIRVATRSAYAQACNLLDLERANYQTLMKSEQARNTWSSEQMMFINALHVFAVSYFTGNMTINEKVEGADDGKPAENGAKPAAQGGAAQNAGSDAAQGERPLITPKKLECPPEQKEKVRQAIAAYVQSAQNAPAPGAPGEQARPQAAKPAPSGAN